MFDKQYLRDVHEKILKRYELTGTLVWIDTTNIIDEIIPHPSIYSTANCTQSLVID